MNSIKTLRLSIFNFNTEETFAYEGGLREMQGLADLVSGISHVGDWEIADASPEISLPAFMQAKMQRRRSPGC